MMRYYQRARQAEGASYWHAALCTRVPDAALDYLAQLMKSVELELHLSPPRNSKLGHFRVAGAGRPQSISINRDLSEERFLLTLVHELAHLLCHQEYGRSIKPHGSEWKRTFQTLMAPLLCEEVFSADILPYVSRHLNSPKATSCVDKDLHKAFEQLDGKVYLTLDDIKEGQAFAIKSGRQFIKGKLRRTRFLCTDIQSKKQYLIHGAAEISPLIEKRVISPA